MDIFKATRHGPAQTRSLEDCEKDYRPSLGKIVPGFYGQFPSKFEIYWAGLSEDEKSRYFILGEDPSSHFRSLTWHEEKQQHKLTLHRTVSINSPPIALCGGEPKFNSDSILVLPAAEGQDKNFVLRPMTTKTEARSIAHTFDIPVGDGNTKTYTWYCKNQYLPPLVYELVESTSATNDPDLGSISGKVLAKWTEDMLPPAEAKNGRMGGVKFYGQESTGEMGDCWKLSIVVALLRICGTHWDASQSMLKGMGRVIFIGKATLYIGTWLGFGYLVEKIIGRVVLGIVVSSVLLYYLPSWI